MCIVIVKVKNYHNLKRMNMKKLNKYLIFSIVFLCCISLIGTGILQPITAQANNFSPDDEVWLDGLSSDTDHSHNADNDQSRCSVNNNAIMCTFPGYKNVSKLTIEEIAILACASEYTTPMQISIQDEIDNGGQRSLWSPTTIKVALYVDEEARAFYNSLPTPKPATWQAWANNILANGNNYLVNTYGIEFTAYYHEAWTSDNNKDYAALLAPFADGSVAKTHGCNLAVLLSGQYDAQVWGITSSSRKSFIMNANSGVHGYDLGTLFQHESSHLFACWDTGHNHGSEECIMCGGCDLDFTEYCSVCSRSLWLNRARFDILAHIPVSSTVITSTTAGGGGAVNSPNEVKGDIVNECYAHLYSGSPYNHGAMIQMTLSDTPISGQLYFFGYSPSANGGVIKVHVGNSAGVWTEIKYTNLYTPYSDPVFFNCGYVTNIDKVAVVAFYPQNGYASNVYIDAVFVMQP
jgi:hypothetical protein